METAQITSFVDETISRLGDIRYELLVNMQDAESAGSLRVPIRCASLIASAASVAGLNEIGNRAEFLERGLESLFCSGALLTHENTRPLLDIIVEIEILLAQIPTGMDDSLLDLTSFVDDSFNFLQFESELATVSTNETPLSEDSWDDEFEIDAEMLEVFAMEAEDLLRNIEINLEILSRQADNREALWEIRRNSHTLKGAAGIVGLKKPSELAHRVEDLLDRLTEADAGANERIFNLLLTAADCLRALTAGESSQSLSDRITAVYADCDSILLTLAEPRPAESDAAPVPAPMAEEQVEAEAPPQTKEFEAAIPEAERSAGRAGSKPIVRVSLSRLDDLVKNVRDLVVSRSVFEQRLLEFEQQIEELHNSTRRLQATSSRLEIDFEASMLGGRGAAIPGSSATKSLASYGTVAQFDALEFDQYTDFHQSTRELSETTSDTFAINTAMDVIRGNFESLYDQQRRLIDEMQERLMRIRMVEFGTLSTRLQRAVRVTCDEEQKKAEIAIENANIEIDTQILDSLIEPLMHLLKNAVFHGIESPDTRRMLGKPEIGRINIKLINEETHIVLIVSDDGRGISAAALRDKAIAAGELSVEDALSMGDEDLLELIFVPGMTTAEKLNLSAGRGVGMSIVKESIENQKGTIAIESTSQKGTTFSVRMPLPLAVTTVVLVRSHGHTFAVPIKLIKHIGEVSVTAIHRDGVEQMLELGAGRFRFRYLDEFLGKPASVDPTMENMTVLQVETSTMNCAIAVDEVIKSEEIVIKPLGRPLDSIKGLLGAAILGSGDLVPILDLPYLLKHRAKTPAKPVVVETAYETIVMIVDDSPSVRHMTSKVVQGAGWKVEIAKDGADALEKLRSGKRRPDIILSDIEMPRMDGYELVSTLKEQAGLNQIPVVFISSRSGEKHREKAFAAGVTEYLAKPYDDQYLVETIKRLIQSRDTTQKSINAR